MVLCGHQLFGSYTAHRDDLNVVGKHCHQFFFNRQWDTNGGNGYLVIAKFQPDDNQIHFEMYSPYLDLYDGDGEYIIDYRFIPNGQNFWANIS